jgi:hypothetical protein
VGVTACVRVGAGVDIQGNLLYKIRQYMPQLQECFVNRSCLQNTPV